MPFLHGARGRQFPFSAVELTEFHVEPFRIRGSPATGSLSPASRLVVSSMTPGGTGGDASRDGVRGCPMDLQVGQLGRGAGGLPDGRPGQGVKGLAPGRLPRSGDGRPGRRTWTNRLCPGQGQAIDVRVRDWRPGAPPSPTVRRWASRSVPRGTGTRDVRVSVRVGGSAGRGQPLPAVPSAALGPRRSKAGDLDAHRVTWTSIFDPGAASGGV